MPHFYYYFLCFSIGGRDSSVGIATCYGLDGPRIESRWGAIFSAPVQTGCGVDPASYSMGTESYPGLKRPGRGVYPPPSCAEVKERVELYLYSLSGPSWSVVGGTVPIIVYLFKIMGNTVLLSDFSLSDPFLGMY
jgi:hypothetical protein